MSKSSPCYFESDFISLLVVLHPSHKLAYFTQAGWPEEWHAAAEDIVRAKFEQVYADIEILDLNGEHSVSNLYSLLYLN